MKSPIQLAPLLQCFGLSILCAAATVSGASAAAYPNMGKSPGTEFAPFRRSPGTNGPADHPNHLVSNHDHRPTMRRAAVT